MRRWLMILVMFVLTAVLAIACHPGSQDRQAIRVGSKDFTEQFILGEMYAQLLEHNGFQVERKLNLGGTPVAQASLLQGDLDLYPEYTGTSLLTVLKLPAAKDPQQVYRTVAQAYREKFNLVWLDPAPLNSSQALIMTQAGSQKYGIKTLSEMVGKADQLTLVGPPEFQGREDGLVGLQQVYGDFQLKQFIPVNLGLTYQALRSGQADVAVGSSTDGEISAFNLVVLQDDRKLFPPYQVAPVVRQQTLDTYPQLAVVLNRLAPKLTTAVMQRLNAQVSRQGQEPAAVAQAFLTETGLLSAQPEGPTP